MSERCKRAPAVGSGPARPAGDADASSGSQAETTSVALRVPYDAVVVGKAYLVDPKYAQANDDMIFLVLAKSPLPEAYYTERDPEKRAKIERKFLVDGVYFYRQNETACGVHHVDAKKLQRAGGSGELQEERPHDPDDNRVFVGLPDGMEWNRHRLFLCCDRLGRWRKHVELPALMRPVEVKYKRPGALAPSCGDDEYFFSQIHGEDFATFINYYPDVPPKSEGEVAKTWEQLRQLYGTNEGSGAPSAYGAQGGAGPSTSAGPSGVLPAQPQPSSSTQPSVILVTSSDEDTSGAEGDVGLGPADSEDDDAEEEEGNSDDDDFVRVPRPGRGLGPATGGGSGRAGNKMGPGARGLPSRTAPQSGQAPGTARDKQQQRGGGARSKGGSKLRLLALPELGLLAEGEVSDPAIAYVHLVPHRTARGHKVEGPLDVDDVHVPRADDPASRPLRKGDKLVMHVCCGMGGASLHGRVNVQAERDKAEEERRKLRGRMERESQEAGEAGGEGGVGDRSSGVDPGGHGAGAGGRGGGAGPSGSGTGAAKAGRATSGGSKGAGETAGGSVGKGSGERTCKEAAGVNSGRADTPAALPGAGAGPAEAGCASRVPTTVGAGSGSGGSGGGSGSGNGTCSGDEGDTEASDSERYSGVVTAGRQRNRTTAGAAAVAAVGGGFGVPLESVMDEVPTDDEGCIRLVNGFACDISRSALQTFLANNPAVGVLCRATELLVLLQLFDKLVRWAQPVRPAFEAAEAARAASGCSPSPGKTAGRQQQPQQQGAKPSMGKGPKKPKGKAGGKEECIVADVLGMRLCHAVPVDEHEQLALGQRELAARDCWLEFLVEWEYYKGWADYPKGRYQWVRLEELGGFTELLAFFVLRLRAERLLPLPGDVFCLVAGPPCQHMSGFNQHANKKEVMKDAKNRIVLSVLSIVEHLRPPFALLEQVVDAGKKGAAAWLRTVHGTYMEMEYQQRTGLIFAASSAAAEGRPRLFVWAADAGYVLPAFPRPTHEKNHLPKNHLRVLISQEFRYVVAGKDAELLPGSVLGDIMWGVESVDNWCMAPLARTRGCPRTVLQHLLSRPPPDGSCSTEERAAVYLGLTIPVQLELALALLEARDAFVRRVGKLLESEAERQALLEEARAALSEQLAVRGRAGSGRRRGQEGAGGDLAEADLQKHIDDMAAIHVARMVLAEFPDDDGPAKEYIGKDVEGGGASKAHQDERGAGEDSWEDDAADDGDAYEAETFIVQHTMDMAHRDLGVRLLRNAQRAVSDVRKVVRPALELLHATLPACDGPQAVGSVGQAAAAAAAAGSAKGQGGGAAGRVVDGKAPASRGLEAAAGGARAAPGPGSGGVASGISGGGSGNGGGGIGGGDRGGEAVPLTQLLQGRLTNHFPALLTPTEEHRVMCVPPHPGDPTTERPSFKTMKGPIRDNCTALWEPIMKPSVRECQPKCASKTPYGRWGRREVIHTVHGGCRPYCACVLHPDAHRTLTLREWMSVHGFPYHYVLTAFEGLFCRTGQYQGLLSRRDSVLGPAIKGLDWAAQAVGAQGPGAVAGGTSGNGGSGGSAVPGGGTAGAAGGAAVEPLALAAGKRKSAYRRICMGVGSGGSGGPEAQGKAKQGAMTRLKDSLQRLQRLGAKMQKQVGDSVCPLVAEGLSRELLRAASLAVEDGGRSGLGPEWSAGLGAGKAVREAWEWRCERPEERMGGWERSNGKGLVVGGEGEEEDEQRMKAKLEVREPEEDSSSEEEDWWGQQEDYGGVETEEGQEDDGEEDEGKEDEGEEGEEEEEDVVVVEDEEEGQDEPGEDEEDEGEVDEGEEVEENEGGDSGGDDNMGDGED